MDFFHKLLEYFNISETEFDSLNKKVSPESFMRDYSFKNMSDAVNLVRDIVNKNGKIHIYGDYDADGIMGTSILVKMFSYINKDVTYYIPNRYNDGYGINLVQAQKIINDHVALVICVDNGVSAVEPINLLKENGIKVLVLDHHEVPSILPNADVIIHPFISELGKYSTSGASVAFNFSIAFLNRFDKYLSTLAAISLISDMMPIHSYNRDLLRIAIENYNDFEFQQIDLLKGNDSFSDSSIGMSIAPKINSVGRLIDDDSINDIVKYFVSDDKEQNLTYFGWINNLNEIRKEASKKASENLIIDQNNDYGIVQVVNEKEGLIGLIAGSLTNKYKKPSIVFAKDSSGECYKGSARSLPGCNIVELFNELSGLMTAFGGHAQAGGCSVPIQNIEQFKLRFNEFVKNHPVEQVKEKEIEISITDITFENYELVKKFGPYGEDWKAPIFNLQNIKVSSLKYSRDGNHIVTQIGTNSKITGFYVDKSKLNGKDYVDFTGKMRVSEYKGIQSVDFLISNIK